jgi:hypothetical protein
MKKTLVSLIVCFASLIGFCDFANADFVKSWDITTGNTDSWKIASLLEVPNTMIIDGRSRERADAVFKNYVNGFTTVYNQNDTLSAGSALTYGGVKKVEASGGPAHNQWPNSITSGVAKTGEYHNYGGNEAYTVNNFAPAGYYVFQTKFSLSPETSVLSGLFMNVDIDINIDDFLEGIFLNGHEITTYSSLRGADGLLYPENYGFMITNVLELTGSISLDSLIDQGWFLTDGDNTLEFVVRNTATWDNPFSFVAVGDINISDKADFDHSFAPTPEPATLLICLTCGGFALAIRRRKNKKTE